MVVNSWFLWLNESGRIFQFNDGSDPFVDRSSFFRIHIKISTFQDMYKCWSTIFYNANFTMITPCPQLFGENNIVVGFHKFNLLCHSSMQNLWHSYNHCHLSYFAKVMGHSEKNTIRDGGSTAIDRIVF